MTFFTLLGKTFSSLILAWGCEKKNLSKAFIFRIIIFTFAFAFLCVSVPIWYFKAYLPYQEIVYPPLIQTNTDIGTIERLKKDGYMLSKEDGGKIYLNYTYLYADYVDTYRARGSLEDPKLFVKVWWFPMKNISKGWIAQVERNNQIVISYEQQYREFIRLNDHSDFCRFFKFFLVLMLIMVIWEFLVQYIKYRQENN